MSCSREAVEVKGNIDMNIKGGIFFCYTNACDKIIPAVYCQDHLQHGALTVAVMRQGCSLQKFQDKKMQ